MNARFILEQLMRQMNQRSGSTRSQQGSGGMGGLLKSSALGLLMGSKRGRALGAMTFKYGLLLEGGKLAWHAWQRHQQRQSATGQPIDTASKPSGTPLEALADSERERRSLMILRAMVAAAWADGHIDDEERTLLLDRVRELGADDELMQWLKVEMRSPVDLDSVARHADSEQAAMEMYMAAASLIDTHDHQQRDWLDRFAAALNIAPDMARDLEQEINTAT